MLKVGVIGLGAMGKNHARVYSELPEAELVGVADVNFELAQGVAKRYNTVSFTDYKELLKQEVHAVSIAVPTSLHSQVAVDTARAGVNMLVEKPIANTVDAAAEIVKSTEENGVKLMIGHVERFNPVIPIINREIQNDEVILIETTRIGPHPPRVKDVGVIVDLAVHDIDLIRYLTRAEFKRIHAVASGIHSAYEDCAILLFEMTNGVLARVTVNWLTPFRVREINIATRQKYIRASLSELKVNEYWRRRDSDDWFRARELNVPFAEPLRLELQSFVRCVKGNGELWISGEEGLKALEVAIQCLSCQSHLRSSMRQ